MKSGTHNSMSITVGDISNYLSQRINLALQEEYDNSGLQIGDPSMEVKLALLSLDVTEDVLSEAIDSNASMIISHHPLIFKGLKSLSNSNATERIVALAIKNNIAIYSAHTNLDIVEGGVSYKMAELIGLKNISTLSELEGRLLKIVVFVPAAHLKSVRLAMYDSGGGKISKYDHCSFATKGKGTFRALEGADPFVGEKGQDHSEDEYRLEVIVPDYLKNAVVKSLLDAHPYEEVAYDIIRLENNNIGSGLGCYGELPEETKAINVLEKIEKIFDARGIKFSGDPKQNISRVAVCGGSGAGLIKHAKAIGADLYVSADIKYHAFLDGENSMMIADIGHYESEKFSLDILYEIITKKFPKFAIRFSKSNKNPINYLRAWKK